MSERKHTSVFGWILLVIGGALILNHWFDLDFEWSTLVMILGGLIFTAGLLSRDHGAVLPGSFLFLTGLFFILKEHRRILLPWWDFWVLILLALGIAFVVHFIVEPGRKGRLLPGVVLIVVAFVILYSPWTLYDFFQTVFWLWHLWPLVLVILGIHLIVKALAAK
jgi:hypothetical protein